MLTFELSFEPIKVLSRSMIELCRMPTDVGKTSVIGVLKRNGMVERLKHVAIVML